jgi:putative flippase GtrA
VRYVFVGGFNTVFGYCTFVLLNWLLRGLGSFSYMYAAVLAHIVAVTAAFLGYKWFVFRTRANYLVELIRCFGAYGTSALITLCGLPILVPILRHTLYRPEFASYVAGAIMTAVTVLLSFVGHKNFSFREALSQNAPDDPSEKI